MNLFMSASATFSPCERYRYTLTRVWDRSLPLCGWCMLNPSKATAEVTDPTIARCCSFADGWGFGGILVVNAHALRSKDPRELYKADDPTGPDNDAAILQAARDCGGKMVVAWGVHGKFKGRGEQVLEILKVAGVKVRCLGKTQEGFPRHPLFVGGATDLQDF